MSTAVYKRNKAELDGFADQYPYAAVTGSNTSVAQSWRDLSVSRLTARGVRMWRFKTIEDRDAFVDYAPSAEKAGRL